VGANVAGGYLSGAQVAVGANFVREDSHGWQVGVGANVAAKKLTGAQLGAGINYADTIHGAQLAPINYAGTADGLQWGVVNVVGEGSGGQLGVLNLARHSRGFTAGVLNLIGDGIHSVAAYATESMVGNLSLKLGSRHLYTAFQFAFQPGNDLASDSEHYKYGTQRFGFGLALGWRQPLAYARFRYLEVEAGTLSIRHHFSNDSYGLSSDDDDPPLLGSLRVQTGIEIGAGLHAIVGVSYNVAIGWHGRDLDLTPNFLQTVQHSGQTTVREYPGLVAGIQY
jgi:hypothetical protein